MIIYVTNTNNYNNNKLTITASITSTTTKTTTTTTTTGNLGLHSGRTLNLSDVKKYLNFLTILAILCITMRILWVVVVDDFLFLIFQNLFLHIITLLLFYFIFIIKLLFCYFNNNNNNNNNNNDRYLM